MKWMEYETYASDKKTLMEIAKQLRTNMIYKCMSVKECMHICIHIYVDAFVYIQAFVYLFVVTGIFCLKGAEKK